MDAWLEGPYFVVWLSKFKNGIRKARCSLCHKTIELSTNGRSALTDHAKGKKYGDPAVKRKKKFKSKSSEAFFNTKVTDDNQQTLDNTLPGRFF